jgi:long-chain acyl-CoA synthetase
VYRIPNNDLLGTRVGDTYEWMTWAECADITEHLSYGFMALGMAPTLQAEGTDWRFIGIQSKNRKEWNLTNVANMYNRITTISLYDTLGVEATKYILNQTELTTMVVSIDYVEKLAKMKKEDKIEQNPRLFRLANLVAMDSDLVTEQMREACKDAEINLYSFAEVIEKGREAVKAGTQIKDEPTKEDTYMMSYTSGTTGDPKGVKLTH